MMKCFIRLLLNTVVFTTLSASLPGQDLYELPPFDVRTDEWQRDMFDGEIASIWQGSEALNARSMAQQLDLIPGLAMQRRGFGAMEPNLRGFTMDRVTTTFNGHYLPIAAPTHTASPVNFFGPIVFGRIDVISGYPSVTLGPVPAGGRINVETSSSEIVEDSIIISGFSNPTGWASSVMLDPLREYSGVDSAISLYSNRAGQAESGDNLALVDEDYAAWGLTASAGGQPFENASLNFSSSYHAQMDANNPSLPMDSNGSETVFVAGEWIQETGFGEWMIKMGFADIRHGLSSEKRPVSADSPIDLIQAQADARSYSGRLQYRCYLTDESVLRTGIDYIYQNRDALRERHLKSGSVLRDQIWPDITVKQAGVYLELAGQRREQFDWRLGVRLDANMMDARKVDAAVVGVSGAMGDTIFENFAAYHGSDRDDIRKEFWSGSIQVVVKKNMNKYLSLGLGADYTVAPPGPGESYRAFLNALGGGLELGNPMLDLERKHGLSFGLQYTTNRLRLSSQAWYARINDFILRGILTSNPLVYSFRNTDCEFEGLDVAMWIQPFSGWGLELFACELSYSRANLKESVADLSVPEVPPSEVTLDFFWNEGFERGNVAASLNLKHVARKTNPQPALNPVYQDTDSFLLIDVMFSFKISGIVEFQIGISNIFDELCYAYLQPPVATGPVLPAGGNLNGGDPIPLPGRSFLGSLKWQF